MHFYESGAIKSVEVTDLDLYAGIHVVRSIVTQIESPIGTITIDGTIEFYESGCPKKIYLVDERDENGNYNYPTITVNGITATCYGDIYFWDSKNLNEWICKELRLKEDATVAVNNTNIVLRYGNKITFHSNGQIEYISGINASKEAFKTPIGDVWLKYDSSLSFYDDGSVSVFCADELVQVKLDNKTFNIPSGEYIHLYKNGVPKMFKASNAQTVKMANYTYEIPENNIYIFSNEGKLKQFSIKNLKIDNGDPVFDNFFVETFYTDGYIKKIVKYDNLNSSVPNRKFYTFNPYKIYFLMNNGDTFSSSFGSYSPHYTDDYYYINDNYFYFEKKSDGKNFAMIYFSDD